MYKISVILPTFNVEKYLEKSFNSLLSQTIGFENLQIIFVDDCSTDNSRGVIDYFAEMYDNVISIHLDKNSGAAGRPRNEGVKFAIADYILFLDPDDYLMEDACETLYGKIIESNVDIVVGGYWKRDWKAYWISTLDTNVTYIEDTINNVSIFMNPPGLAAKLLKKELILKNNIKFPEKIPAQDLVFLTECYLSANSILSLNKYIVYCYYVRDEENDKSISNNVTTKYLLNLLTAYNLTLDLLTKFNVNTYLKNLFFSRNHISFFVNQLQKSDLKGKELENFLNSDIFLKFRNQEYILNDDNLNNFFKKLEDDYNSVKIQDLTKIWQNVREQFINSESYVPEKEYLPKNIEINDAGEVMDEIEKNLHQHLKKVSKLNNSIIDFKRSI